MRSEKYCGNKAIMRKTTKSVAVTIRFSTKLCIVFILSLFKCSNCSAFEHERDFQSCAKAIAINKFNILIVRSICFLNFCSKAHFSIINVFNSSAFVWSCALRHWVFWSQFHFISSLPSLKCSALFQRKLICLSQQKNTEFCLCLFLSRTPGMPSAPHFIHFNGYGIM